MIRELFSRRFGGGPDLVDPNVPYLYASYSRHDLAVADALTRALADKSILVKSERTDIEAGTDWRVEIRKLIDGAAGYLIFWSPSSIDSYWLSQEAIEFGRDGAPVVHILIDGLDPNLVRARFHSQNLRDGDFIVWDGDSNSAAANVVAAFPALATSGQGQRRRSAPQRERNKGRAFLSYTETDTPFVEELVSYLRGQTFTYWEYQDGDRNFDLSTFKELEEQIKSSQAVLCVLSPAWRESDWTIKEYFYAKRIGKPTFLLMFADPGPTLAIEGETYIDLAKDREKGFKQLSKELRKRGF